MVEVQCIFGKTNQYLFTKEKSQGPLEEHRLAEFAKQNLRKKSAFYKFLVGYDPEKIQLTLGDKHTCLELDNM